MIKILFYFSIFIFPLLLLMIYAGYFLKGKDIDRKKHWCFRWSEYMIRKINKSIDDYTI